MVPEILWRKLLDTLHFGHAGLTKMTTEARIFWWPSIGRDTENGSKNCRACMNSGKNPKHQIPSNKIRKLEKLTEPG